MATREYASDELRVLWDAFRCVHIAACIRAQPRVFNSLRRPWVSVDAASTSAIIDAIERCPTGALRYVRTDGVTEIPDDPATIEAVTDCPLVVRGEVHLTTGDGETITRETRVALCRCGASENKPFYDNTHRWIGFHSDAAPRTSLVVPPEVSRAAHEAREHAERPRRRGAASAAHVPLVAR